MKQHKKKWLFDKGKTSGSRKRYAYRGDFADERNTKKHTKNFESLPSHQGMKPGHSKINRLSFSPLRRFLKAKTGQNWDAVYSEIVERIPKDILHKHNPIEWYVVLKAKINPDGSIVDKKNMPAKCGDGEYRGYISKDGIYAESTRFSTYYVHPVTNELCRLMPAIRKQKSIDKKKKNDK